MTKINWISRQFSRFDLALTKLSRPLTALNTFSNLSVALVVGTVFLGFVFTIGFLGLIILGYVLDKSGFLMQTRKETFDQQEKELWSLTTDYFSAKVSYYNQMSPEDLEKEIKQLKKELRL